MPDKQIFITDLEEMLADIKSRYGNLPIYWQDSEAGEGPITTRHLFTSDNLLGDIPYTTISSQEIIPVLRVVLP